jgi:hypothetical protein
VSSTGAGGGGGLYMLARSILEYYTPFALEVAGGIFESVAACQHMQEQVICTLHGRC